jgi:excisionase family DNA binding protein
MARMAMEPELLSLDDQPPYVSVNRAAGLCDVHPLTIRSWIKRGLIEATRFGRTVRVRRESLYRRQQKREQLPF